MISQHTRTLAIDWGAKTIGLAVGQTPLGIRPLPALTYTDRTLAELDSIIDREQVELLVIGKQADDRFMQQLTETIDIPIRLVDEELTSVTVSREFKASKISPHSLVACLILEQYFSNNS